jgi:flagellar biogenesis protein FliO
MISSPWVFRAATLLGVLGNAAWSFAETASPPVAPALPEVSFSILRVLGALALVLALFLGGVWCFKNWQRVCGRKGRGAKLNVLEVKSLGNRQALLVVAFERQRLLLASSSTGVSLVSHLPEAGTEEAESAAPPAFAEALQRVLAGAKG